MDFVKYRVYIIGQQFILLFQTYNLFKLTPMLFRHFVFACLLALYVCTSTIKQPISLAVTVYNDDFAIVKDVRSISFDKGISELYFTDVSPNIQPQTVTFKAVQNQMAIKVYEQNYEANLINTNSILQKYINKKIEIVTKLGNNAVKINGILLGYNSGYILKTKKGIEVFNNIESIGFPSLPAGFLTLPALNWKVYSNESINTNCEVAYRTTGFSWKADYSLILNDNQTSADIGGWVTIDNQSGKKYEKAKLKLIAGEVNTISSSSGGNQRVVAMAARGAVAPSFSEKSFSDYHLYTLSEPVTLNENEQKQVEFIPEAFNVTIRKYNLVIVNAGGTGESNLNVYNRIEFENSQSNKLGIPLPKGIFRVYKTDSADNSLEFVGQDSINHTPRDETVMLTTGSAFDIVANKVASNYQSSNNGSFTADLNLTIFNHKNHQAEIVVQLNNYYGKNDQIIWNTPNLTVQNITANLYRISKVFQANESYSYLWSENYRP